MRIIYNQPLSGKNPEETAGDVMLTVIHPSPKWLAGEEKMLPGVTEFTIEERAKKDVPAGLPYKIVEDSYIPTDRAFRDAWEIDDEELTDGVGAAHGTGAP
jgi:hypothetical protein